MVASALCQSWRVIEMHTLRGENHAHAGSRTRVTSMGGLYDAATLHALVNNFLTVKLCGKRSHVVFTVPRFCVESHLDATNLR